MLYLNKYILCGGQYHVKKTDLGDHLTFTAEFHA